MVLAEVKGEGDRKRRLGRFGGRTIDDGDALKGYCIRRFNTHTVWALLMSPLVPETHGFLIYRPVPLIGSDTSRNSH